jgi:uncharacterized protein (DUF58 family)
VALSTALIIALSTFAGLFLTMAIGVGLIALYQTEAATYGVNLALAIVATVLVVATLILMIAAWLLGRSLSKKPSSEIPDSAHERPVDVTTPSVVPAALQVRVTVPAASETAPVDSTWPYGTSRVPDGEVRQISGAWSSGAE